MTKTVRFFVFAALIAMHLSAIGHAQLTVTDGLSLWLDAADADTLFGDEAMTDIALSQSVAFDAPAAIPLGRAAVPDDVATVAEFLISDAAAYVTGQTINIDGGMRHD